MTDKDSQAAVYTEVEEVLAQFEQRKGDLPDTLLGGSLKEVSAPYLARNLANTKAFEEEQVRSLFDVLKGVDISSLMLQALRGEPYDSIKLSQLRELVANLYQLKERRAKLASSAQALRGNLQAALEES